MGSPRSRKPFNLPTSAGSVDQIGRVYVNLLGRGLDDRVTTPSPTEHLAEAFASAATTASSSTACTSSPTTLSVALDRGLSADAVESAQAVLRVPRCSTTPRILTLVVLALVQARRGDPGVRPLLEEAWALAEPTGELPRIAPVAVARAEVAWLEGRADEIAGVADLALDLAVRRRSAWRRPASWSSSPWRRRAGIRDRGHGRGTRPFVAQVRPATGPAQPSSGSMSGVRTMCPPSPSPRQTRKSRCSGRTTS